jgi:hypothetical protein
VRKCRCGKQLRESVAGGGWYHIGTGYSQCADGEMASPLPAVLVSCPLHPGSWVLDCHICKTANGVNETYREEGRLISA